MMGRVTTGAGSVEADLIPELLRAHLERGQHGGEVSLGVRSARIKEVREALWQLHEGLKRMGRCARHHYLTEHEREAADHL